MTHPSTEPTCPLCASDSTFFFTGTADVDTTAVFGASWSLSPQKSMSASKKKKLATISIKTMSTTQATESFYPGSWFHSGSILPPAFGLDFGCGPAPALATLCREAGYHMDTFDPFYAPFQEIIWERSYDFLTCTEVVEHLRQPGITLPQVWSLLRPGGCLGIMTKLVHSQQAFANWHYIRDETHIAFYSQDTFLWLAKWLQAKISFHGQDVILLIRG